MLSDTLIKKIFCKSLEEVNRSKYYGTDKSFGCISPFSDKLRKESVSSGLSSCGYDLMLSQKIISLKKPLIQKVRDFFSMLVGLPVSEIDTHNLVSSQRYIGREVVIPSTGYVMAPGETVLGVSEEYIAMPDNIAGVAMEKSTLARIFLNVTVTPIEPGWKGFLTYEIKNNSDYGIRIYAGMGITQLTFSQLSGPVEVSYADRKGKYKDQEHAPVKARG